MISVCTKMGLSEFRCIFYKENCVTAILIFFYICVELVLILRDAYRSLFWPKVGLQGCFSVYSSFFYHFLYTALDVSIRCMAVFAYCTFLSNFISLFIVVLTPCPVYSVCTIVAIALKDVPAYICVLYLFSNFSLVLLMILSLCPAFRAHMSVTIELRTVFVILSSANEEMNTLAQSNSYQTICAATALFLPCRPNKCNTTLV